MASDHDRARASGRGLPGSAGRKATAIKTVGAGSKGAWRRIVRWLAASGLGLAATTSSSSSWAFGFDDVAEQARALAASPYVAPSPLPPALAALSYDDFRRIRFRPADALWRAQGLPFQVQFFHAGRGFTRVLTLHEIVDGRVRPLEIPRSSFDDEGVLARSGPSDAPAAIAGFRVHYPLNNPHTEDELIAFLGASYFRALGAKLRYGLSARGIAIDTTGGSGEEFPAFTTFWLERPQPLAHRITLYALLDGPRVAGAYRFVVTPGASTTVDVEARLWLRAPVAMLGLAPLSSMFLHGENQPVADDYRPEVHDSDGLQIEGADGEWIWRPLIDPQGTFVTSFALRSPRGFGLIQRDRAFASYQDLEARYERRPSVWVEPLGDWGEGRVELLQFHTPDETHDNIAAYWVPARLPAPGVPLSVAWRLHWSGADVIAPPGARVVQSRRGHGYRETAIDPLRLQFHIDFAGPALDTLPADAGVQVVVSGNDNARHLRAIAYPNAAAGGWRVTLDVDRADPHLALELRAFLRRGEQALSETWSYALAPE